MNKELLEQGADMQNYPEKYSYQRYLELGGIINENDYNNAMTRAKKTTVIDKIQKTQAENIANYSEIELHSTSDIPDPIITLYGILRSDIQPKKVKHHHSQMSDQRIFVEALRMLGDVESLEKMVKTYPHISFKYQEETGK